MSRVKEFSREEVLEKALGLFWIEGYAATGVKDLEQATGVNKSGLYSEFRNKEDLFLASLRHYFEKRPLREILKRLPAGWQNIEDFMKASCPTPSGERGCFAVNTLRELKTLPPEAQSLIRENRSQLKRLFAANVPARSVPGPDVLAEIILTFYYGLQAEQNIESGKASFHRRITEFLSALKIK